MDKKTIVLCLDFKNDPEVEEYYIEELWGLFNVIIVSKKKLETLSRMCHCPTTARHIRSYVQKGYTLFVQNQFTKSIISKGYTADNIISLIKKPKFKGDIFIPEVYKFKIPLGVKNPRSKRIFIDFVCKNVNHGQQC